MPSFDGVSDPDLERDATARPAIDAPELWGVRPVEIGLIALVLLLVRLLAG